MVHILWGIDGHLELNESVKDQVLAKAEGLHTRHTFLHFMPNNLDIMNNNGLKMVIIQEIKTTV